METVFLLRRRLGMGPVREFVDVVLECADTLWVGDEEHALACAAFCAAERRDLSLVDCSSFVVMRRTGVVRVFAFDDDFQREGLQAA